MTEDLAAKADGRLANPDSLLHHRASVVDGGPAHGMRALDLRAVGGIDVRILPDRGFDVGAAWYSGVPLAWVSAAGERGPLTAPEDLEWSDAFGGGLLVTCGLRNVGMPSEGHGLHGTFSHLRANDVNVNRILDEDGGRLEADAVIDDGAAPGSHLRLERSIRTWARRGRLEVTDTTINLGREPEPAPILYHCNFGYPLWDGGARLEIPARTTTARDPASEMALGSWDTPPAVEETEERVLEHEVAPGSDGFGWARLTNLAVGVTVTVRWRTAELPRMHQWIDPSPGMYVLGLEPANCSTSGRAHDRAEGRLPHLSPGERRETAVVVEAEPA